LRELAISQIQWQQCSVLLLDLKDNYSALNNFHDMAFIQLKLHDTTALYPEERELWRIDRAFWAAYLTFVVPHDQFHARLDVAVLPGAEYMADQVHFAG